MLESGLPGWPRATASGDPALGMVAEGVPNTLSIHEVTRKIGVRTPIIDVVYGMLYENIPPAAALDRLYEQAPRDEHE